jgi:ArsR family metal-binding transcriptional regulator
MTRTEEPSVPFFVKLCSDKAAFEARPAKRLSLNMNEVKHLLEDSKGHEIIVYTPHILILRSAKAETTLSRDGRMLIKKVANEAEATQIAQQLLQIILKSVIKQ